MGALAHLVAPGKLLLADGAWGTNLMAAGLDITRDCAEHWNLLRPDAIRKLGSDFVAAGARILTTNTFGANRVRLASFGLDSQLEAINRQGVALLREVAGSGCLVVASMGPVGIRDFDGSKQELGMAYGEQARILEDSGADALLLETMTSPEEATIALNHIKRSSTLDVIASFAFTRLPTGEFCTWSGANVQTAVSAARDGGAVMTGINCCPADHHLGELLASVHREAPDQRIWLKPNAGAPPVKGTAVSYENPVHQLPLPFAALTAFNVGIIGGCCGTTPDHIHALAGMVSSFNAETRKS